MLEYTRYCNASIKPLPTPWRLPEIMLTVSISILATNLSTITRGPHHTTRADAGAYQAQTWKAFGCVLYCCVKRLSPFTVPTNPWVLGSDLLLQVFNSMLCDGSIPEVPSHWHSVSATKMFSPLTTYTYSTHHAPRGHLQNFLLAFFCGDSSHISHPWQCRQKPSVEGAWSFICLVVHGLHSNSLSSRGAFLETGYARWFWQRQQWKYGLFPRQPAKCRSTRSFTFTRYYFCIKPSGCSFSPVTSGS